MSTSSFRSGNFFAAAMLFTAIAAYSAFAPAFSDTACASKAFAQASSAAVQTATTAVSQRGQEGKGADQTPGARNEDRTFTRDRFKFETMTMSDGLPSNYVTSIAGAPDGSVYFGTWGGVVKYDGQMMRPIGETGRVEGIIPKNISSLYIDGEGTLWIGTLFYENAGLFRYRNGQFERFTQLDGMPSNNVTCISGSSDEIFIGTWGGGLAVYDGKGFSVKNKAAGLSDDFITSIDFDDNSKSLWVATKFNGANLIRGGRIEIMDDHTSSLVNNNVHKVLVDPNQNYTYFGTSGGISRYNGATWQNIIKGPGSIGNNFICSFFLYRSILYFITGDGMSILSEGNWSNISFDSASGFHQAQLNAIYVDERFIYIGTDRGLYKIGRRN